MSNLVRNSTTETHFHLKKIAKRIISESENQDQAQIIWNTICQEYHFEHGITRQMISVLVVRLKQAALLPKSFELRYSE